MMRERVDASVALGPLAPHPTFTSFIAGPVRLLAKQRGEQQQAAIAGKLCNP
jgi:hypothetical protein